MRSISFQCIFDALGEDSERTEIIRRRAELMNKARELIEDAGGVLVRTDEGLSPATFKVPSNHYDLIVDQLDDLVLENIVQFRKDQEEVEICIDDL